MEIRKTGSWLTQALLRGVVRVILWQKRVRDWLLPRSARRPPKHIALFASMELLGGGILISAITKTLKQLHPTATVYLVGERHRAGRLEWFYKTHAWVDEVIFCPPRLGSTLRDWWRFYRELRTYKLDMAVLSPNHSCSNSVFLYLCGVREIVGADLPKTWTWHGNVENRFLTRRVSTEQIGHEPYRLLYFPQAYARTLLGRNDFRLPELVPYVRFQDSGLPGIPRDRPLVTMHPGGPPRKRWSVDGYVAIGRLLIRRHGAAICVIGGPPEAELVAEVRDRIARECPGSCVVNCAGDSMNQTLTCIAHSVLYVGNSAGPMHLAVALGVPTIAVLTQYDRWFSGPEGAGGPHTSVFAERVADVKVGDVWEAIQLRWRPAAVAASSL